MQIYANKLAYANNNVVCLELPWKDHEDHNFLFFFLSFFVFAFMITSAATARVFAQRHGNRSDNHSSGL